MGTVYLALDRKHGRRVALKVLPPDVGAAIGAERFLREIQIVARLTHPHILPLHDSGQIAGLLYYVMPWIEGESLRDRLEREGRLPVDEALAIGREIADALSYAHRLGVVHRDVKPENILLAGYSPREGEAGRGWHALLADFGVARTAPTGTDRATPITESGMPLGTPAYASPEQAAGSRSLDGRTDIYSLGCVLYELLVGAPAGGGATAGQLLERRFGGPLPAVRTLRPEVPDWVDGVLSCAMAGNPADRFASAGEFREALCGPPAGSVSVAAVATPRPQARRQHRALWMAAGASALAIVAAAVAFLPHRTPSADPKQVVVAGFENKTGDSALAPVGDIATDYIARGLAATRLLHEVYDARATAREAGEPVRVGPAAGRELARKVGAGTVLWGSYYRDGDSLHFETQLLDAASGRLILSLEPAVGPLGGRTQLVEVLRQRVMAGFGAVFQSPGFEPWEAQSIPPSYEAYREFLAGSEAGWQFDFDRAAHHFRRAAALDSTYASAKTALAFALEEGGDCTGTDSIARLVDPIRDRLLPVDRGNLDYATATCRGDLSAALEASRGVMEAAPRSIGFTILASVMALELFRPREALTILRRLEPRRGELTGAPRGMYWSFLADAYHQLGEHRRELEVVREGGGHPFGEAVALAALGRVREARQLMDTVLVNEDSPGEMVQCVALEIRAHGHPKEGQEVLKQVVAWYQAHPAVDAASSDHEPCLWLQLSAFYDAGWWDEARAGYDRLAAEDSASVKARAALGAIAVHRGDQAEVSRMDQWLASHRAGSRGRATYARARLAALLGDRERAVALLRQAFDEGLHARESPHIDPDFESLRDYPPYQELMRPKG
jgi:tRNA A-37 threonylcarbamoyl transferase component Bud32/tetratricopeptide (TPR) repeat protein/TolB-like protein